MRPIVRGFILSLALLLSFSAFAALEFNDQLLVYNDKGEGFPRERVKQVFIDALTGSKPVVLFVHGRGDEPRKSLSPARLFGMLGGAVSKIEKHGVNVVMFSWDSKAAAGNNEDRSRPLSHMDRSAERLGFVLDELALAQAELKASGRTAKPITLLAHSMGTIILPTYLARADHRWPRAEPMFRAVVLTSADADRGGHDLWLNQIANVERTFVTVNKSDRILKRSAMDPQRATGPLGLDPGTTRAARATYLVFDDGAHELFAKREHRTRFDTLFAGDLEKVR